jgi:hypothetical protein
MDAVVGKGDGHMYVYTVDPKDCRLLATSEPFIFGSDFHEPGGWVDPKNPKRMLVAAATFNEDIGLMMGRRQDAGGTPQGIPDLRVMAITDEKTGEMLSKPVSVATFRLQDVGGPVTDERPDATGLFSDGRFADWSKVTSHTDKTIPAPTVEGNGIHQATISADGARIYVAGGSAGFYILDTAGIAAHSNADIISGAAGCNASSTNIFAGGVVGSRIEPAKLAQVANDCVHMVVNNDPGVKAMIAGGRLGAYIAVQDRSRWDPFPPRSLNTGIHSAIPVPDRPSLDKYGAGRPSMVVLSEERFDCPYGHLFIIETDSEATPQVMGTFGLPDNVMENCLKIAKRDPNDQARDPNTGYFSHDPNVFKNLVFISWYGEGLRAIDISNPTNPREVGHALPIPGGQARSYPVYKDGLFYWMDYKTGIHVVRYTGPRANELPRDGLVHESNSLPHR